MKYDIENIATIIKGKFLVKSDNSIIEHLLTDSRNVIFPDTSLFFALQGLRRNGHDFIYDLLESGVKNFVLMDKEIQLVPAAQMVNVIHVKNTLDALQAVASWHRKQFSIPVIGITGSNGKTIVKDWLHQLLSEKFNIVRSPKSYNSQIGVPLSVCQMNPMNNLAIFEAGISTKGEMERLQKIIDPTIGLFTNIGEAHSEGFSSIREKLDQKLLLFKNVNTLFYCSDQLEVEKSVRNFLRSAGKSKNNGVTIFNWSKTRDATLQVISIVKKEEHTLITVKFQSEIFEITIPFSDAASIENAIHCLCVLLHLDIPFSYIKERMLLLSPVAMRMELMNGINNCSIINDSYSADMSSLRIALDFLSQQKQHSKKTVIMTDIFQSGKSENELFSEVAKALVQRKVNKLIGIGERIGKQREVFEKSGKMEISFYPSVETFKTNFHPQDFKDETILLKGARIFHLEQVQRLFQQQVHETLLEIDLNALVNNLKEYQRLLQPSVKLMAMVKAFSYGSGSYEIANVLQFHKVDYLSVAYADEGVDLRKGGISLPIMVMNPDESSFNALVDYNLEPELYSENLLHSFSNFLKKEAIQTFPVHIELETGMNRLGFSEEELPLLLRSLEDNVFKVQSVFTHLVASEDPAHDGFTKQQFERFINTSEKIRTVLPYSFLRHIANSAAISRHSFLQLDMVRLGIGLYGIDPQGETVLDLKEVSRLKSTIAQIKDLKAGETVSYGRSGVITKDSKIATVRIGYADGYPRSLSNGIGKMSVNGYLAPIKGVICMDMTMIDVSDIPGVKEGDEVVVFGPELPVKELAIWANTIPYEILTGVSQRVKRIYFAT